MRTILDNVVRMFGIWDVSYRQERCVRNGRGIVQDNGCGPGARRIPVAEWARRPLIWRSLCGRRPGLHVPYSYAVYWTVPPDAQTNCGVLVNQDTFQGCLFRRKSK